MNDSSPSLSPTVGAPRRVAIGLAPLALVVLAALLRWIYYHQVRGLLLFNEPTGDSAQYVQLAGRIREAGFWAPHGQAYFQGPLYPWYLALDGAPGDLVWARGLQWVGGVLGTLLAWDTTRRVAGPAAALWAGLLAALYGPRLFFEGELLSVGWALLSLQVVIWLFLLQPEPPSLSAAAAAGGAAALAALAQPNALLVGLALGATLLGVAWRGRLAERPRWRRAALGFLLALTALLAPVAVRNYRESGEWVLISSNAGVNFFIGNNADADGGFHLPAGEPLQNDNDGLLTSSTEAVAKARGGTPGPATVSAWWWNRGLAYWGSAPLAALGLTARKILLFWNGTEIPNHYAISFFAERVPVLRILPGFLIVAPLSLWGLGKLVRARRATVLLTVTLAYAASVVPFFVTDRYRLPVIAALLPAAGVGAADLFEVVRRKGAREMAFAGLTVALVVVLTSLRLLDITPASAHMHNLLGALYYKKNQLGPARREFEAALELMPRHAEARNNVGRLELLAGNFAEAERSFRAAIEVEPRRPEAWFNLEELERNQGRWAEALKVLTAMESSVPGVRQSFGPALLFRRGLAHQALGDTAAARGELEAAVRAKPDLSSAWAALGGIERSAGRPAAARRDFERAVEHSPEFFGHAYNLGLVCEQLGDNPAALAAYEKATAAAPNEPEPAYRAALLHERSGSPDRAESLLRMLSTRNFAPAVYQLGRRAELAGRRDEALQFYRRVMSLGGRQAEVGLAAARLAALEGKS